MAELNLLVPELSRCLRFVSERTTETESTRWLGQARPVVYGHRHLTDGLFRLFGYQGADNHPSAAMLCHSQIGAGEHAWVQLTPARFEADLTRLVVSELPEEALVEQLPAAFIEQLTELLQEYDLGLLHHGRTLLAYGNWLNQVSYSMPVEETLGRNVAEALPTSSEPSINRRFRRLFNEMQMLLHAFFQKPGEPFQLRFNGFWPHGAGRLPTRAPKPEFDRVHTDWPLARALAERSDIPWQPLPARMIDGLSDRTERSLVVWHSDSGRAPEQRVQDLIQDCLRPLQSQLVNGRLTRLTVLGERLGGWVFEPGQRWRFWRRRTSLIEAWQTLEQYAHAN